MIAPSGRPARRGIAVCLALGLALLSGCGLYELDEPPDTPTDLRVSDGTYANRVVLVWAEVESADRYEIWRSPGEADDYEQVGIATEGLYVDTEELTVARTYWYKVRACGPGGCSEDSERASGYALSEGPELPLPPTGVTATDGEHRDWIRVTWEPAEEATEYIVHRATQHDGPYEEIATTEGTTYDDEDVDENVVYWYRVQSEDEAGRKSMKSAFDQGWAH
ncbi:MAG: hypothetical protein R6U88_03120 [Candidatus Bipolaricaulota bacterium]